MYDRHNTAQMCDLYGITQYMYNHWLILHNDVEHGVSSQVRHCTILFHKPLLPIQKWMVTRHPIRVVEQGNYHVIVYHVYSGVQYSMISKLFISYGRAAKPIHCAQKVKTVRLYTEFNKSINNIFLICHILWHFQDLWCSVFKLHKIIGQRSF